MVQALSNSDNIFLVRELLFLVEELFKTGQYVVRRFRSKNHVRGQFVLKNMIEYAAGKDDIEMAQILLQAYAIIYGPNQRGAALKESAPSKPSGLELHWAKQQGMITQS
jgi:hypothetical protein